MTAPHAISKEHRMASSSQERIAELDALAVQHEQETAQKKDM